LETLQESEKLIRTPNICAEAQPSGIRSFGTLPIALVSFTLGEVYLCRLSVENLRQICSKGRFNRPQQIFSNLVQLYNLFRLCFRITKRFRLALQFLTRARNYPRSIFSGIRCKKFTRVYVCAPSHTKSCASAGRMPILTSGL